MPMFKPLRGHVVYLYVAHPERIAKLNFGVKEVGTGVVVVQSHVNHLHIYAFGCFQRCSCE